MRYYISPPPVSPLTRIIASVFAVLAIAGAVFLGLFVLAAAVAFGLLAWLGFTLRLWWLRRKRKAESPQDPTDQSKIIDAEYTVISRRRD